MAASVGRVGSKFLLNVKLLDIGTSRVLHRSSEIVAGEQDALLVAIERAAAGIGSVLRPEVPGVAPAQPAAPGESEPADEIGFGNVAPWLALGLGVALAGAGGVLLGLGQAEASDLDGEVRGTGDWSDLRESAEGKSTAGVARLGVAGAAVMGHDKAQLHRAKEEVRTFLAGRLKLTLHSSKATVTPVRCGVVFLGYRVWPFRMRVKRANVRRFARREKRLRAAYWNGEIPAEDYWQRVQSWIAFASHADSDGLLHRLGITEGGAALTT